MRHLRLAVLTTAIAASFAASPVLAQSGTVKIGFIEPLSGAIASIGQSQLNSWQVAVADANAKKMAGGVKFEIVPFDGKGAAQESLTVLQQIIDQGIRYVAQGTSSAVTLALTEAISKHNERNPGKELVFLDYAAQDPALTNERCSFWHFRFDIHADMKMEALTSYLEKKKDVKKVYLINQDYAFGRAVNAAARKDLARKRSDVQVVGEDLHPMNQIKDFSPYVAKIKASGADTVITGNWGPDLALMIKAAKDAGLNADFYTYNAGNAGMGAAMGSAGADRVHLIVSWHPNIDKYPGSNLAESFREKYNQDITNMQTCVSL